MVQATNHTGVVAGQTNRVDLGRLTLSKSDVAGLDRLMAFYRAKQDGLCTTVDRISLMQRRHGKTVATEEITDGTCQTYDLKHITRFPDLIARVSSQKP